MRKLLAVLLWGDGGFPLAAAAVVFDWQDFQPASHRKVLVGRVPKGSLGVTRQVFWPR